MQAAYFPKKFQHFEKGEQLQVSCNHDEYSLWFDIGKLNDSLTASEQSLGNTIVSRNRLGQINDRQRNDMFLKLLRKYENAERSILIANDDLSLLPILAAQMNFKQVFTLESNRLRKECLKKFISLNELTAKLTIIEKSLHELEQADFNSSIDYVLSELAFTSSHLPWENMYFYYATEALKKTNAVKELPDMGIDMGRLNLLPYRVRFYAIAVQLENLHKIRSPVIETCGFSLKEFDKVILEASKNSDCFSEPHPLWEYPCRPLSDVQEIFCYDSQTQTLANNFKLTLPLPIKYSGDLNGIVMWHKIDYDESDTNLSLNTGLMEDPIEGVNLVWEENYKQAVRILNDSYSVSSDDARMGKFQLNCHLDFNAVKGKFDVDFRVGQEESVTRKAPGHMEDITRKLSV